MRIGMLMAVAGAAALAGCARTSAPGPVAEHPIPFERESISYSTGACFGACPIYTVTVFPDGTGIFNGERFTAVTGERSFKATAAQYQAFARKLAPWRPDPATGTVRYAPGEANCEQAATDLPSATVTWTRPIGDAQTLSFYFGCFDDGNRALAQALGDAPDVLPIADLIGERP